MDKRKLEKQFAKLRGDKLEEENVAEKEKELVQRDSLQDAANREERKVFIEKQRQLAADKTLYDNRDKIVRPLQAVLLVCISAALVLQLVAMVTNNWSSCAHFSEGLLKRCDNENCINNYGPRISKTILGKGDPRCAGNNGFYGMDDEFCQKYYKCDAGVAKEMTCKSGQQFDAIIETCVDYTPNSCTSLKCWDKTSGTAKANGKYTTDSSCKTHFSCINGTFVQGGTCRPGMYANSDNVCQEKLPEGCVAEQCIGKLTDNTKYEFDKKCRKYFTCKDGKYRYFDCPSGKFFDPEKKLCDAVKPTHCLDQFALNFTKDLFAGDSQIPTVLTCKPVAQPKSMCFSIKPYFLRHIRTRAEDSEGGYLNPWSYRDETGRKANPYLGTPLILNRFDTNDPRNDINDCTGEDPENRECTFLLYDRPASSIKSNWHGMDEYFPHSIFLFGKQIRFLTSGYCYHASRPHDSRGSGSDCGRKIDTNAVLTTDGENNWDHWCMSVDMESCTDSGLCKTTWYHNGKFHKTDKPINGNQYPYHKYWSPRIQSFYWQKHMMDGDKWEDSCPSLLPVTIGQYGSNKSFTQTFAGNNNCQMDPSCAEKLRSYRGAIKDVYFWRMPLTAEQINETYNGNIPQEHLTLDWEEFRGQADGTFVKQLPDSVSNTISAPFHEYPRASECNMPSRWVRSPTDPAKYFRLDTSCSAYGICEYGGKYTEKTCPEGQFFKDPTGPGIQKSDWSTEICVSEQPGRCVDLLSSSDKKFLYDNCGCNGLKSMFDKQSTSGLISIYRLLSLEKLSGSCNCTEILKDETNIKEQMAAKWRMTYIMSMLEKLYNSGRCGCTDNQCMKYADATSVCPTVKDQSMCRGVAHGKKCLGSIDCDRGVFEPRVCPGYKRYWNDIRQKCVPELPDGCVADGVWAVWSSWGECSVTSGVGLAKRSRTCLKPRNASKPCDGSDTESVECGPAEAWVGGAASSLGLAIGTAAVSLILALFLFFWIPAFYIAAPCLICMLLTVLCNIVAVYLGGSQSGAIDFDDCPMETGYSFIVAVVALLFAVGALISTSLAYVWGRRNMTLLMEILTIESEVEGKFIKDLGTEIYKE